MPMIRMLTTIRGSNDGITSQVYEAGKEYPVGQVLATIFVSEMEPAVAEYLTPKSTEEKAISKAPENAAMEAAPSNKVEEPVEEDSGWVPPKKEAKTVRVHELADKLGATSRDILMLAGKLGIDAKSAFSGLTEEDANKIKANFKAKR